MIQNVVFIIILLLFRSCNTAFIGVWNTVYPFTANCLFLSTNMTTNTSFYHHSIDHKEYFDVSFYKHLNKKGLLEVFVYNPQIGSTVIKGVKHTRLVRGHVLFLLIHKIPD